MLPPEIVSILSQHTGIYSLYALSQTCHAWRNAICDFHFRDLVQQEQPWYELEYSPRESWKECAKILGIRTRNYGGNTVELVEERLRSISADTCGLKPVTMYGENHHFRENLDSWEIHRDVALPADFVPLAAADPGAFDCGFYSRGFTYKGVAVDLSSSRQIGDEGRRRPNHDGSADSDPNSSTLATSPTSPTSSSYDSSIYSRYGIDVKVDHSGAKTCSGSVSTLAVMVFPDDPSISEGLLFVKHKSGLSCSLEPDEIIRCGQIFDPENTHLQVNGPQVFVITRDKTFVATSGQIKQVDMCLRAHPQTAVLCYDGVVTEVHFSENLDGVLVTQQRSATDISSYSNRHVSVVQDPVRCNVAVSYRTDGSVGAVIDLETQQYIQSYQDTWPHFVMVGTSESRVAIWSFTPDFLKTAILAQHGDKTLEGIPIETLARRDSTSEEILYLKGEMMSRAPVSWKGWP